VTRAALNRDESEGVLDALSAARGGPALPAPRPSAADEVFRRP